MLTWRKKLSRAGGNKEAADIHQTILDENVKQGFVEIMRAKRNAKSRPQQYFIAERPIADLKHTRIEELLLEDYGGGEYFVKLHKSEGGKDNYIASFTYNIDGPQMAERDDGAPDLYKDLAYKSLEKQLNTNPSNITEQLLLRMIDANSGKQNSLLDQVQILKEIGELTKSQIPVIPPENETAAMMQMISTLAATYMASRMNPAQPAIAPTSATPSLAEIKLPSGGNGSHGPNEQPKPTETKISLQDAFYAIYLEQFKLAAQEGADVEEFAGMIESMAVNAIGWIPEPQWHPIIAEFVKGYSKMDLAMLNSGFERLMAFAEIGKETADKIKTMLLAIYQNNVAQLKAEGTDAGEQG